MRCFLLGTARNLVRKRWRVEQRWDFFEDDESFVSQPIDPGTAQIADLVGQAVQALPPLQREALVLFEYEALSLEEIARTVDVEVGTVKARLSRASACSGRAGDGRWLPVFQGWCGRKA